MDGDVFGEVAEKLRRSTVQLQGHRNSGSGVVWGAGGKILTNAHVLREGSAQVEFWSGRQAAARVVKSDRRRDLAVLQVESELVPAATPGDSDALRPGELVIAVGSPFGFTGAVSTGVVVHGGPWIVSNVRLGPGSSGGPLANARGEVVGLNTMIAGGLALAVPSNTVADFLRRGPSDISLGVVVQPIPEGLLVLRVMPGSAAERASLLTGDLLVGVERRGFRSPDDLSDALDRNAGRALELSFMRGERRSVRQVTVRLPARRMVAEAA